MADTTFYERRSSGGMLGTLGAGIIMALLFVHSFIWTPPMDDDDPDCRPGFVQMTRGATPDAINFCVPDAILEQVHRVVPPR